MPNSLAEPMRAAAPVEDGVAMEVLATPAGSKRGACESSEKEAAKKKRHGDGRRAKTAPGPLGLSGQLQLFERG